jgi:hypothetical protein
MLMLLAALGAGSSQIGASSNATLCIACTLLLTLAEERASSAGQDSEICQLLDALHSTGPAPVLRPCAVGDVLPSPDELCKELDLCDGTCQLFPGSLWPPPHNATAHESKLARANVPIVGATLPLNELENLFTGDDALYRLRQSVIIAAERLPAGMLLQPPEAVASAAIASSMAGYGTVAPKLPDPCGLNISCLVNRIGTVHLPLLDSDGDAFAPTGKGNDSLIARRARGSHWRGADCNDLVASVYPGRRAGADLIEDTNCNGIHGGGEGIPSYEEKWCAHSSPRGVIALGDSATAHFHIPPALFSAANFR